MLDRRASFHRAERRSKPDRKTVMARAHARSTAALWLLATVLGPSTLAQDTAQWREQVRALGTLSTVPAVHPAEGRGADGTLRPLYLDGLPYRGQPTRVFAWYGTPDGGEGSGKSPAMALVHGGGGTAFKEWVKKWNEQGFAAISLAVEGQTDEREADGRTWKRHPWAGPAREGIYGDSGAPLADQWMYHAVADVVLADSWLRSLPEVDEQHVGLMGISWGGIVASTVAGIDTRLAFVIPTYGCGALSAADNQYGQALRDNPVYREVWEPTLRLSRARMPMLWLTWLRDAHFPLDVQQATYRAAAGPRLVAVLPDMGHSHSAGWRPPDSYAFARSVVAKGSPWARQTGQHLEDRRATVRFESERPIQSATLIHTADAGYTGRRRWQITPAQLDADGTRVRVASPLPAGTRAFFFNLDAGGLTASSEFTEVVPPIDDRPRP
jgi:cephalosporin-C deacetylase-like acetyl esterase